MKIYLGRSGSSIVRAFAKKHNCGWCISPDNARPVPGPYFVDNGAFKAWKDKTEWDEKQFFRTVKRYSDYDFVVDPDIVCGGWKSLERSLEYLPRLKPPVYLAVQDGMMINRVVEVLEGFDGIFVGGSLPWKFSTARSWADTAHLHKLKCHVGRVGTWEGLIFMHHSGVDSVDTTTPCRHQDDRHIVKYYDHLKNQSNLCSGEV